MLTANEEKRRQAKREASTRWREANRDKSRAAAKASMAKRRQNHAAEFWTRELCVRAKTRRLEFDLTAEFLEALLAPMVCSMTGIVLSHERGTNARQSPWMPSVDRVDSKRGYTKDNVRVVCWAFNLAKGPWDDEVVLQMARALTGAQDAPNGE